MWQAKAKAFNRYKNSNRSDFVFYVVVVVVATFVLFHVIVIVSYNENDCLEWMIGFSHIFFLFIFVYLFSLLIDFQSNMFQSCGYNVLSSLTECNMLHHLCFSFKHKKETRKYYMIWIIIISFTFFMLSISNLRLLWIRFSIHNNIALISFKYTFENCRAESELFLFFCNYFCFQT